MAYKGKEIVPELVKELNNLISGKKTLIIVPITNQRINEAYDRINTSYMKGIVADGKPRIHMVIYRNKQGVAKSIGIVLAKGAIPDKKFGTGRYNVKPIGRVKTVAKKATVKRKKKIVASKKARKATTKKTKKSK